ncbi:arginase family protein [Crossiella sp. CA-258035]|uniref:arginase family protein n=1 Tax=Crossiella sp. CA-258035 TaxID=2981138 RepID=UPI0024BC3E5A|nr:arginase family protein [Crossiella sp. CA-258035]WHT15625.1 arginase family protein [Crossiella sp. CA-258035]
MTTVLCVPQWQGSASDRAPLLASGAHRTAELLRAGTVVSVPIARGGDDITDGIRARAALVENLRLTGEALAEIDDFTITVGGDCGVDLAPIAAARQRYGDQLTVLWIDAHPDVYGPGELPSGAFHGMVVRTLLGDGFALLTPARTLAPAQVVLAGVRAGGASEGEYLRRTGLRVHGVGQLEQAFDGLSGPTYVHVDLDVLDPAEFGSVCYPEPAGVRSADLVELISGLDNLVGAAITEHAPAGDNPGEADIIRRLGAALHR